MAASPGCPIATQTQPHTATADTSRSYTTWLVSDGVPVNVVQRVMGHEQASTTLNRYTHTPDDCSVRVLAAFDGSAAFSCPQGRRGRAIKPVHAARLRGDEGTRTLNPRRAKAVLYQLSYVPRLQARRARPAAAQAFGVVASRQRSASALAER